MAARQYYLIQRRERLTKGKPTWYCRFRSLDGALLPWRSTSCTTKTAAENWAIGEIRAGREGAQKSLTFERYAEDWWTEGHSYVRGRLARGSKLTATYLVVMRGYLQNHILPSFRQRRLTQITPRQVEDWVLGLGRRRLSPSTINHALRCLKIMLKEATRHEIITRDPSTFITGLAVRPKERGILTVAEVKALLDEKRIDSVWGGDKKHFTLNLLAASTGMRMGECQALPVGSVFPDHLAVTQSWERRTGLKEGTKTGAGRIMPLPSKTAQHIAELTGSSPFSEPDDLVFYGVDGHTPMSPQAILKGFYRALERIGISGEERKRRCITFHSHRHFLNTLLRTARIPDPLVQRVTGHRTQEMTENYTHFRLEDFKEVVAIQEGLI